MILSGHRHPESEPAIYRRFRRIKGRHGISLVYRIFLRKHVDRFRRKKRQYDRPPAQDPDPASAAMARERNDAVRGAITGMSSKLQMILVLRYIEERSYSEISSMYHVPIGTLRSRMCEALRRLRTLLEKKL